MNNTCKINKTVFTVWILPQLEAQIPVSAESWEMLQGEITAALNGMASRNGG